jgi:hypothetical protein
MEAIWAWYNSDVLSRLHNDSKQLIIMTRWDSADLVGRILGINEQDGDSGGWHIVNLPAIKENDDNDEDPRVIGEALWGNRHGLKKLLESKRNDPRTFQSLMQQNPMPVQVGGEAYKDFDALRVVGEYKYNANLPLHISFDFNVNPYITCSVWQVQGVEVNDRKYYTAVLIKEFALKSPKNTTKDVCSAIKHEFFTHVNGVYIYGDPRGVDSDTRSEKGHNDYTIILSELRMFAPKLKIGRKAEHVQTRISFMNSIFRGGQQDLIIKVDKSCIKSVEDWQYIKEDSDGTKFKQRWVDPSTGVKCERWGHFSDCFSGDTLIDTDKGKVRIDRIKIGDRVLTRNGYNRVLNVWDKGVKTVKIYKIGDSVITCTPNHKVWTEEYGFMPINDIYLLGQANVKITFSIFDENLFTWSKKSLSITEVTSSTDTLIQSGGRIRHTIQVGLNTMALKQKNDYIGIYGSLTMEQYLKGIIYTTLTGIQKIMIYQTLNAKQQVNI